jgi:hypothetical protein
MDYLKIGKATELEGKDRFLYRLLEILPGTLAWGLLLLLIIFSYFQPVWVAFFVIIFDIYWLLLVLYLSIHLFASYFKMKEARKTDWRKKCEELVVGDNSCLPVNCLTRQGWTWQDVVHLIFIPTLGEPLEVLRPHLQSIINDGFPTEKMIYVLAIEEREGAYAVEKANILKAEFGHYFRNFIVTIHPDGVVGELKGKGANQAYAARRVKEDLIDKENIPYEKILVSVWDSDTVIYPGYFFCLTHCFLTVDNPYRASYQPIPLYHNNIWEVPFFSRVAASSNTFWQMMQQIRVDKLATYSSHAMTWKALVEINFWSTTMVSEDSRVYWHCFLYYNGDYRVEPLYFPVSMDSIDVNNTWKTLVGLYKQQRRWGWGVENVPYLLFNSIKRWDKLPKKKLFGKIFVQLHGFHSWATNALIVGFVGWLPLFLGGQHFNSTVLSGNLPGVARILMTFSMSGLIFSAIISTLLLPHRPKVVGFWKKIFTRLLTIFEWLLLPLNIVLFGSIPALDSQTRLMFGKYMGFLVTPKERK